MNDKVKILLADDHTLFREGVKALLNRENFIEICGIASNGQEALQLCKSQKPDIVILDISMPLLNGFEVSDKLFNIYPDIKIIFLTMHKLSELKKYLRKKNIFGLVLKENSFEDLIYAIKAVANGGKFISPLAITDLLNEPDNEDYALLKLSEREKEILKLLVDGLSSKEIAQRLFISQKTVETHKSRIMKKLNVHRTTDLIKKVIQLHFFK